MHESSLLHELVAHASERDPAATALIQGSSKVTYGALQGAVAGFASGLIKLGTQRAERVAIYLEKRQEMVVGCFGTAAAGAVFVPLNPLLKPEQVGHVLRDCGARVLLTSPDRLALLHDVVASCPALRHVVTTEHADAPGLGLALHQYADLLNAPAAVSPRVIDSDMLAILYTSGSTGRPKGVVLSHRNMVTGAKSVAGYLENRASDVLVAALPLSFDAGFTWVPAWCC